MFAILILLLVTRVLSWAFGHDLPWLTAAMPLASIVAAGIIFREGWVMSDPKYRGDDPDSGTADK